MTRVSGTRWFSWYLCLPVFAAAPLLGLPDGLPHTLYYEVVAASGVAAIVVDRLRAVTPSGQTFSAGIATWDGQESPNQLVARADGAMYEAKHAGRDRSMVAALTDVVQVPR